MSVIKGLSYPAGTCRGPAGRPRPGVALAIAVLVMVATGGVLAGCGVTAGGSGAGSPSASAGAMSASALPLASADGLNLPIEQYLATSSENVEMDAADQILVSRCMATFGFQFTYPAQPPVTGVNTDPANMLRRYGVSDPSIVDVYGYHIAPIALPAQIDVETAFSDAEYDVFWGHTKASKTQPVPSTSAGKPIPAGGCTGLAGRELNPGSLDAEQPLAEQIDTQSFAESQTDPQVIAATSAWSGCMAKSGYTVATPLDAMAPFTGPLPASSAEITEAKADLACKTQTKLISIWVGVETRIQDQLIAKNQLALTQGLHDRAALLSKAAAVAG